MRQGELPFSRYTNPRIPAHDTAAIDSETQARGQARRPVLDLVQDRFCQRPHHRLHRPPSLMSE